MKPPATDRSFMATCVRQALKSRRLTQEDLAQRLSVTPTTVNNWLTAKNDFPAAWLSAMASKLDMAPAEFFVAALDPDAMPTTSSASARSDPTTEDAELLRGLAPIIGALADDAPDLLGVLKRAKLRAAELLEAEAPEGT